MAEGPHDTLDSIEKSLQSMKDLDIHPRSSQLLLLNGCMAYHFLFVDVVSTPLSRTVFKTLPLFK